MCLKKNKNKTKNNITLLKRSLVVCARTNFSEGIPSLIALMMIMIKKIINNLQLAYPCSYMHVMCFNQYSCT